VLPAIRSVGVQGDERRTANPIVIRAFTSDDAMTADWGCPPAPADDRSRSSRPRIVNEIPVLTALVLD